MHFWVVCFFVFFGAAEFYQWVQGVTLPVPVFVVAGMLLAIASNYNKPAGLPWRSTSQPLTPAKPTPSPVATTPAPTPSSVSPSSAPTLPELPNFSAPKPRSISFTIRNPDQ